MQNPIRILLMSLMCIMISGCALSLGPQVKTTYVIVHPGKPLTALENIKIKGRLMDDTGNVIKQDIGGWKFMPPDHWEVIKNAIEKRQEP